MTWYHEESHFTDEGTEWQGAKSSVPHSCDVVGLGLKTSLSQSPCILPPCYCMSLTAHLGDDILCRYGLVAKSGRTLCDPVDGFPVLIYLPELSQTHVHWVSDAIQPSHCLSPTSPPALNLSHHQGLFPWVGSPRQVAKVLYVVRVRWLKDCTLIYNEEMYTFIIEVLISILSTKRANYILNSWPRGKDWLVD